MDQYEIRVLRDDGRTSVIVAAIHLNDNSAVRSAQKIAGARKFEVWRGADCVYGTEGALVIELPAPDVTQSL
jgi:hypothetical protein